MTASLIPATRQLTAPGSTEFFVMSASPFELRPNEPFPPFGSLLGSGLNRTGMAIAQLWSSRGKAADAAALLLPPARKSAPLLSRSHNPTPSFRRLLQSAFGVRKVW